MFRTIKVIDESVESLHEKSIEVSTPVSEEDKRVLLTLFQYVVKSQNKEISEQYNIRPGVGIAAPQIGVNKRMFAIHAFEDDKELSLAIINPVILSTNKEQVYLNGGEGCLSVNRKTVGITPRYSKITIQGLIFDFEKGVFTKKKMMLKDYFAIVFQHEFDHLDGILYTDKLMDEQEAIKKNILSLWEIEEDDTTTE